MTKHLLPASVAVAALAATAPAAYADYPVAVHGSVQAEIAVPEKDEAIGAERRDKWDTENQDFRFNTYVDVNMASQYLDAGLRGEYMKWPLPGYDPDFKGWGLSNFYVKGKYKGFDLTAGDFYEQFGSGLILRTYEERSLGVDNAIRGGRLNVNAINGLRLTVLGGVQRTYWDWSKHSQVYGANAEAYLQNWIPSLRAHNANWMIGASYVLKHERDEDIIVPGIDYRLNLPKCVNAIDARTSFSKGGWNILGEFAWKGQDPSFYNDYTYAPGTVYLLSGSYSKKGLSAVLQAKRSENMSFRSQRSRSDLAGFINNMPAFAYQHTYALAALYPYATQLDGEWAFQGSFTYNFKRKTPLGGKYGTKMTINASYISSLVKTGKYESTLPGYNGLLGTNGYKTSFFKMGPANYWDFNIQIEKKFSAPLQMTFMYMNQFYNNAVITGIENDKWHGTKLHTNLLLVDAKYKFNRKYTLRGEVQYMFADGDQKDWAYGLLEFSLNPWLMVTVSDMWNCGDTGNHYYKVGVTGNYKANRLMVSYGRTRAGFDCSGGVCREVPAMKGLAVSYSYNF